MQTKIATLHPQLEAYKNHKDFLLNEQHNLKLKMAASEKDRMLKEGDLSQILLFCSLSLALIFVSV